MTPPAVGHRTLFDPREAGGSFTESGITIDVREVDTQRVTVPRSDTVSWYGTVLCTGQVFLQVEGSPFDSPIAPAALILTAATAAGFTGTFWSLFRGRP